MTENIKNNQQKPEDLLNKLYAVHEGIIRHMELLNSAKKITMVNTDTPVKVRWFKLNSILLNFGLIKQSKNMHKHSLCCYKCNQIMFSASFTSLI